MKTRKHVWMLMFAFGFVGCSSAPRHTDVYQWKPTLCFTYAMKLPEHKGDPEQKFEVQYKLERNAQAPPKPPSVLVATLERPVPLRAK